MALLTRRSARLLPGATFLLVLGSALPLACFLQRAPEERGLAFSHALHYGEEGLDCESCHVTPDEGGLPGMPVLGQCMLCHESIDEEKEPSRRIETLFDGDEYRARHLSRLSDEVIFVHEDHALDESLCGTCHEGIEESTRLDESVVVTMDDCSRCHQALDVPTDCATCHTEIRSELPPPSHASGWTRIHGQVHDSGSAATSARCDLCHAQQDCDECHLTRAPESHTDYWRRRAHGLTARMDRESCATCHRTDSCDACHAISRPANHRGTWGSSRNTHCLSCHIVEPEQGCFACHQGGQHPLGAPQPPSHVPGMNCLQCHGLTAPLPHVHKGEDCTICHM